MITDYMIGFVQFLNKNNYNISNDKLSRFFSLIYSIEISFTNERELLGLMKTVFCNTKIQVEFLPKFFEEYTRIYMKELETEKTREDLQNQQNMHQSNYKKMLSEKEDLMARLDAELQEKLEEIKNENVDMNKMMSAKDKKFLRKNMETLKKINEDNEDLTSFLTTFEQEETFSDAIDTFEKNARTMVDKAEKLLFTGKVDDFNLEQEFYNVLKRVSTKMKKSEMNEKIEKAHAQIDRKREKVEKEIEKEKREHERIMNELQQSMQETNKALESEVLQKEMAKSHREEFIGRHATQSQYSEEIFTKNFEKLNQEEKFEILRYMKRNLLKFKTKMSRNIHSNEKLDLNMQATIQDACRTGGLPMNLIFNKPVKNKTNLVLVLDVSGSCSSASKMMLTFMYLLKDVFPRGCDAFAFVNSLYDISEIMRSNDIETSVNKVLNVIPRKGVYSNYYKPMETLWNTYRKKITKDSIVIFMGDARNNKNATAEEFMKNIGHRAKKCIWLNTEKTNEWDKADSIASVYGKYAKMYEVVNAGELIEFIEEF